MSKGEKAPPQKIKPPLPQSSLSKAPTHEEDGGSSHISKSKDGSLAWLAEKYVKEGHQAAKNIFLKRFYHPEPEYKIIKFGQGQPSIRRDSRNSKVDYEIYPPPTDWGVPYQLLHVIVKKGSKELGEYLYHGGEEILIPREENGNLRYDFSYHNTDHKEEFFESVDINLKRAITKPILRKHIIRINCALPHHTWYEGENEEGGAWMVVRPLSKKSPLGITLTSDGNYSEIEAEFKKKKGKRGPARKDGNKLDDTSTPDFQNPANYALVAWGLSERIQTQREISNLTVADAAFLCGINAAHFSRIEQGTANVSLDILVKIAKKLEIRLDDLVAPIPWFCYIDELESSDEASPKELLKDVDGNIKRQFLLRPIYWRISRNVDLSDNKYKEFLQWTFSSWIVLEGQILLDIAGKDGEGEIVTEVLTKDSVIHFHRARPKSIEVRKDTKLIQFIYERPQYDQGDL